MFRSAIQIKHAFLVFNKGNFVFFLQDTSFSMDSDEECRSSSNASSFSARLSMSHDSSDGSEDIEQPRDQCAKTMLFDDSDADSDEKQLKKEKKKKPKVEAASDEDESVAAKVEKSDTSDEDEEKPQKKKTKTVPSMPNLSAKKRRRRAAQIGELRRRG